MRPYIAIIWDSFREALNSRILWLVLGIITLILVGLAPLGVSYPMRTAFSRRDIRDMTMFAQTLQTGSRAEEGTPLRTIWDSFDESLQDDVQQVAKSKERDRELEFGTRRKVTERLNELVTDENAFSPEQWQSMSLKKEGDELRVKMDDLPEDERQRLNRLAIESCFRRDLRPAEKQSVQIHYLGFDVADPIPIDRDALRDIVKMSVAGFMNLIAATFGVLIAILVTASIIPNMFDTGSVNLLFSKPIVRSLMYLSKFVGGLSFVLINAAYLIIGVWLIVGLRFGVWHQRLLYVIPILLFLFAVYYSVSSFAGMVWRNTVIAISAAICLWGVCFAIGMTYDFMDALGHQPRRVVKAVATGDGMLTVAENGDVNAWSAEDQKWAPVFAKSNVGGPPAFARQNSLLGPVYDPEKQRVLVIDPGFSRSELLAGYQERDWGRETIDAAPGGCLKLLREPTGGFVVVERQGISRIVETEGKKNLPIKIFGLEYSVGPKRSSFQSVGPKDYDLATRATAATINPDDGAIIIYGEGTLHRLTPTGKDRHYEVAGETDILDSDAEALLAAAGDWIAVIDEDAQIHLLDRETLKEREVISTFPRANPRFATAAEGGRYLAVVCHNRKLFVYDVQNSKNLSRRVLGQGNVTAAEFAGPSDLVVADRVDRVRRFDVSQFSKIGDFSPRMGVFDKVFYWAITPLNTLLPNPSKLKETSAYLLTEQETIATTENKSLAGARAKLNPWPPVYKSAIFIAVMLLMACVYIHWQEF